MINEFLENSAVSSPIFFILGSIFGYVLRFYQHRLVMKKHMPKKKKDRYEFNKTGNTVLIIITVAVVGSVIAEVFVPTYKTNPLFYTFAGTIAGLFFANNFRKADKDDE